MATITLENGEVIEIKNSIKSHANGGVTIDGKYYPPEKEKVTTENGLKIFNNTMESIVEEMSKKIQDYKDAVIEERLKSLGLWDAFEWEKEYNPRFSRFIYETQMSRETIWYNDNTIDGLKVIEFTITTHMDRCEVNYI